MKAIVQENNSGGRKFTIDLMGIATIQMINGNTNMSGLSKWDRRRLTGSQRPE